MTALKNTAEGFSDSAVVEAIKHGFPLVGVFPSSGLYASPLEAKGEKMSLEELRENREFFNRKVFRAAQVEKPYASDLSSQAVEEAETGAMSFPEPVDENIVAAKSYSRRIPVRELLSKGWRTRSVDHYTEGGMNGASVPQESPHCDNVDIMLQMVIRFLGKSGKRRLVRMWKRDFSKAYRRIGIVPSRLSLPL